MAKDKLSGNDVSRRIRSFEWGLLLNKTESLEPEGNPANLDRTHDSKASNDPDQFSDMMQLARESAISANAT